MTSGTFCVGENIDDEILEEEGLTGQGDEVR